MNRKIELLLAKKLKDSEMVHELESFLEPIEIIVRDGSPVHDNAHADSQTFVVVKKTANLGHKILLVPAAWNQIHPITIMNYSEHAVEVADILSINKIDGRMAPYYLPAMTAAEFLFDSPTQSWLLSKKMKIESK